MLGSPSLNSEDGFEIRFSVWNFDRHCSHIYVMALFLQDYVLCNYFKRNTPFVQELYCLLLWYVWFIQEFYSECFKNWDTQ
jgi:hypothetical protein